MCLLELKYGANLEKSAYIFSIEDAQAYDCMGTGRVYAVPCPGRWSRQSELKAEQELGQLAFPTALWPPVLSNSKAGEYRLLIWAPLTLCGHFSIRPFIFSLAPRLCNKVQWEPERSSPHHPPCHLIWDERTIFHPSHVEWAGRPASCLVSAWEQILPSFWVLLVKTSMTCFSLEL